MNRALTYIMELAIFSSVRLGASHKNGNHCPKATQYSPACTSSPRPLPLLFYYLKERTIKIIIEMPQNEQNENGSVEDILAEEIESWKDFRYTLREENAVLFNVMLSECGQNIDYNELLSLK